MSGDHMLGCMGRYNSLTTHFPTYAGEFVFSNIFTRNVFWTLLLILYGDLSEPKH